MSKKIETNRLAFKKALPEIILNVNSALSGRDVKKYSNILKRIGRGNELPHWYTELEKTGTLPNLDGKTIGSVIEMLLVAASEKCVFEKKSLQLRINPARGVDLPDLGLGVKSPSENFCTSEPYFSAYERLIGSEHAVVVLLTDYQERKKKPPLKLQITNYAFLEGSELADRNLCVLALKHRDFLLKTNEAWAKKLMKFLCFVNQSDWLAKQLVKSLSILNEKHSSQLDEFIKQAEVDFAKTNADREKKHKPEVPDDQLEVLRRLKASTPSVLAIIDACDNWVLENFQEAGRSPNANEWEKLKFGPLNGKIGVSAALQWRYNFSALFTSEEEQS